MMRGGPLLPYFPSRGSRGLRDSGMSFRTDCSYFRPLGVPSDDREMPLPLFDRLGSCWRPHFRAILPRRPILGFTGCGRRRTLLAASPFAVAYLGPGRKEPFTTKNGLNWVFGGVSCHLCSTFPMEGDRLRQKSVNCQCFAHGAIAAPDTLLVLVWYQPHFPFR